MGRLVAENASLNGQGQLIMRLGVTPGSVPGTFVARGAELQSSTKSGYGRYTYRMRGASASADPLQGGRALGGTISGAFSYLAGSATEIDVELESYAPTRATLGSWKGLADHSSSVVETGKPLSGGWHDYAYEWRPGSVAFFVDGAQVWQTTTSVPSEAAHVMLNVWPTNEAHWGGMLEGGDRFMLVDRVSFEPF